MSYHGALLSQEYAQQAVIIDIDDTIADVSRRAKKASEIFIEPTPNWYNEFLDPRHYHLDAPIGIAREWLFKLWDEGYALLLVSGRRKGTEQMTEWWLDEHDFPEHPVLRHRPSGIESVRWKVETINELKENYDVVAGYGDRASDIDAYIQVGIKGILVNRAGEGWKHP